MSWFKVDDGFHCHPKVIEAGNEAIGLFVRCGSYCAQHLTEGFVPRAVALMYGDMALIDVLVKVRMFEPVDGGWLLHDFLGYNPTKEKVTADRDAAARRQRDARERAKQVREEAARKAAANNGHADSHGVTNGVSHTHGDAHAFAEDADRHAVTYADDENSLANVAQPPDDAPTIVAGEGVVVEMSRRDSHQQSRAPRPDPTRPVLPTEVLEEPSSSETASPPSDAAPTAKTKRSRKKTPVEPRADVEALCGRLADLMVARGCRKPNVTDRWRTEARLLLDSDGIHFQFAMDVLEWSQKSSFWKTNILSMPKFRHQWDALHQQAEAACGPHPNNGRTPEPASTEVTTFGGNVVALRPSIPAPRQSATDRAVAEALASNLEAQRIVYGSAG